MRECFGRGLPCHLGEVAAGSLSQLQAHELPHLVTFFPTLASQLCLPNTCPWPGPSSLPMSCSAFLWSGAYKLLIVLPETLLLPFTTLPSHLKFCSPSALSLKLLLALRTYHSPAHHTDPKLSLILQNASLASTHTPAPSPASAPDAEAGFLTPLHVQVQLPSAKSHLLQGALL